MFFFLAGFFAAAVEKGRGPGGLLAHRARRLLVPLLVGCLVLLPIGFSVWAAGWLVSGACTLDEALTLLERDAPSAVLLDLKLNGVDVSEGMVAIKEINPSVLLILYSGHPTALSEAVDQAPAGLVNAAFTKPVPIDDLLGLLNGQPV